MHLNGANPARIAPDVLDDPANTTSVPSRIRSAHEVERDPE